MNDMNKALFYEFYGYIFIHIVLFGVAKINMVFIQDERILIACGTSIQPSWPGVARTNKYQRGGNNFFQLKKWGLGRSPQKNLKIAFFKAFRKIRFLTKNVKFGGPGPEHWKSSILAKLRIDSIFRFFPFFSSIFPWFLNFSSRKGPFPFFAKGGEVPQVPQWRAAPELKLVAQLRSVRVDAIRLLRKRKEECTTQGSGDLIEKIAILISIISD